MSNGIRTTNLEQQFSIDELIGNVTDEGVQKTSRITLAALGNQLGGLGPFVLGNSVYATTRAQLFAVPTDGHGGFVLNDPDPTKNGIYSSLSGSWIRTRSLFDTLAAINVTGGTADAITATLAPGVDPAAVVAFVLRPTQTNTGPTTVSVFGATYPVVGRDGQPLVAGELTEDRAVLLDFNGSHFGILTDPDLAGIASAVAGMVAVAVSAKDAAEAAAASIAGLSATSVQGRLSLTSGVAAAESDVTGATSIYYVPSHGPYVPVYDGTSFVSRSVGSGLTLALDADTGHSAYQASGEIYDLYAIYDGGTLRLATGHPWTGGTSPGSDTARGTGVGGAELETFNGILVNKVGMTARFGSGSGDTVVVPARYGTYLGTFMATANGEATDSRLKRLLFNAYNRALKDFRVREATASWTYDSATVRQANGSTANQVEILLGLSGTLVQAELSIVNAHTDPVSVSYFAAGIGVDSTTAYHADCVPAAGFFGAESKAAMHRGLFKGYPGLGHHLLTWLENGPGEIVGETLTWYGSGFKSGIYGSFLG